MTPRSFIASLLATLALAAAARAEEKTEAAAWWNPEWTQRKLLTLDTGADAAALKDAAGDATVLVRLSADFFDSATAIREDGGDIRFVAEDGKTILPHQIEKFDMTFGEAYVWVRVPNVLPNAKSAFYLYFGNAEAGAANAANAYDGETALVYHFAEAGAVPADSTSNGNNAETVALTSESAIIGSGLRLSGTAPVIIPPKPSLEWTAEAPLTWSAWINMTALQPNAVLFSRGEGNAAFRVLLDNGIPLLESAGTRSAAGAPLAAATWNHLAFVAEGKAIRLFVNGELYGNLGAGLPAQAGPLSLGAAENSFAGEVDELQISNSARSSGWIKLAAVNQGANDAAQRALVAGPVEGDGAGEHSGGVMEHLSLFGDIANNMMFDGWIAIGVCAIMIIVGWTVAIRKFAYLNSIEKGSREFLRQWKSLSSDLTALNPADKSSVSSLGGNVDAGKQALVEKSPLFHIYQIGSDEILHRLKKDGSKVEGLSGRSIQAIRASLDAGLVHESHRLSDGLVYLTMSIAGGPYVGLLGTVVGVMITFAIIAKSGEVNVNSIAPGIASALLATVVGLVVAIPALFIYSYLNGRIKNALGLMQVFIDEFVAKMAEFYRPPSETESSGRSGH